MSEFTPEDFVKEAREIASKLCEAQTGHVEVMANDVARSLAAQLANNANLNYAVLRLLAVAVNHFASSAIQFAERADLVAMQLDKTPQPFIAERHALLVEMIHHLIDSIDMTATIEPTDP